MTRERAASSGNESLGEERTWVHPRIPARHPELTEQDVVTAWEMRYRFRMRAGDQADRQVALGYDGHHRELELIARRTDDGWVVYHAMSPPTKKVLRELGMIGG